MAYTCEKCGFKYISRPEEFCVNCGYSFAFLQAYGKCSAQQLKAMPQQIKICQFICAIPEKDTTKKGLHAYCTLTNQGILLEIYEKFEFGIFAKKKWKFQKNPVYLIPYNEILSITQATFQGKPARFYNYTTKNHGVIPLGFYVDGSTKYPNLDQEVKDRIQRMMG